MGHRRYKHEPEVVCNYHYHYMMPMNMPYMGDMGMEGAMYPGMHMPGMYPGMMEGNCTYPIYGTDDPPGNPDGFGFGFGSTFGGPFFGGPFFGFPFFRRRFFPFLFFPFIFPFI